MSVSIESKDCVQDVTVRHVDRDGLWATHHNGKETFDAVLDESGTFHFRFFTEWAPYGMWGTLEPAPDGGWTGLAREKNTPCGLQAVRINMRP
jgi:hypothetical protein